MPESHHYVTFRSSAEAKLINGLNVCMDCSCFSYLHASDSNDVERRRT